MDWEYNRFMRVCSALLCLGISPCLFAQQPADSTKNPPITSAPCGNGPIDEYLAAKKKARKVRNKNPLPSDVCVGGWCRTNPNGPPDNLPTSHPPGDSAPAPQSAAESSSKPAQGPSCDIYAAVQDVEVGDFYYEDKNYRGALSRYESALLNKPGDSAIFLRLGKTSEKLGDNDRAKREYQASIDAGPDGPATKEAKAALSRLASKKAK